MTLSVDGADVHGGPGRLKAAARGRHGGELGFELQQAGDVARGVFHRVDAQIRRGAVAFKALKAGAVLMAAFVAFDDAHGGRLANDGEPGIDVALFEGLNQMACADAAGFLVIGEGKMHRRVGDQLGKVGCHGDGGGDEAFHVAGAAPVKTPVALLHDKGIGAPVLIGDWHHVCVARKHNAAVDCGAEGGKEVGLFAGRVMEDLHLGATVFETCGEVDDHVEVAVDRDRREGDQVGEDLFGGLQHGSAFDDELALQIAERLCGAFFTD
jgi:hypothetical protein